MDIILVSRRHQRTWRMPSGLWRWLLIALPTVLFGALLVGAFSAGWWARGGSVVVPPSVLETWAQENQLQRQALLQARREANENTQALARRISLLQAHVVRLDAAGSRMTEMAGLDAAEFNFDQPPPLGGPDDTGDNGQGLDPVIQALDQLNDQLAARERQMRVLEDLLLANRLQREIKPSGWPVANGYMSSAFGMRRDPFTGRRTMHHGVDFAGRAGSGIYAVAGGVVTHAGTRGGYGRLVEINHGNGYITRYGHNRKVLVEAGERVVKGQRISLMGSSGRSTGPHVHFEVLLNGKKVNPAQYIRASQ
ncbi:MAG: M23 family metallopeptidase [Panacagrimonas sp.]